ncbi:serine protein kinase PrkA [Halobacteriovorax sp. HLS]|uniref:serine protein kinase PrkA n=1 Tax=Halobacteriovorax sp. HLS TaxID=2234000 RepID=UPI000FDB54AA|nr:serine protein kinase PrkA [Halobacteriovorax sp. HLS]
MDWLEEANNLDSHSEVLSFKDYMDVFEKNPLRETRPTYKYLMDMVNHYGKSDDGGYEVFKRKYPDSPPVYGQQKTQESLIQNLENFEQEGFNNKFILLVGPNGSSKSSLVRQFMKGAETYSKTDEGVLYSFSWIFPIDNFIKGNLGFASTQSSKDLNTYAHLEDKDISAILGSELKDHPLLLIPKEYRQRIISEKLAGSPEELKKVEKSYLFKSDLSKRNRMIYDALLKNYKGKHTEVLKHIRVERFVISKRYSSGAVTIEPQLHVDAKMQQITMDKRLASLPPSLQSLNLFSLQGEVVLANRGILEYSDLLKRPLDTYKYLLMTMETGSINLQGIQTELDIFFLGTSNEIHLAAFKQHPDFNSFKGRMNFIRVPYLLNFRDEMNIYLEQISGLETESVFEPHSLEALCLFATMTRLRASQTKHFEDSRLAKIVTALDPLEKIKLYTDGTLPDNLDSEEKQLLIQGLDDVRAEFESENLYEGKFGISPRDIKNILYKITNKHETITFVEIIDYLYKLIQKKNNYDFLNMTPQGDFHHPARFISLIKEESLDLFDRELRGALGLVDDRSYEDFLRKYIENINSQIKGERMKNSITGKYEESDDYFIQEFESSINLKENAESFRSHLISKLGAWYLDNPGTKIVYKEVFPDVVERLQASFREEQKRVIKELSNHIVFFEKELTRSEDEEVRTPLSEENRNQIKKIITNLTTVCGYSENGAVALLKYIIKERY